MGKVLNELYRKYKDRDVTFNQKIIKSLGLIVSQVSFKCGGRNYPCILYSSSMVGARILADLDSIFFEDLRTNRNSVALRYTFKTDGRKQAISFFINSKIKSFNQYNCGKPNLFFLTAEFINKPANDLIEILGNFLEDQASIQKRIEERIVLSGDNGDSMGIELMENFLFRSGKGKRCILTEISIFSAKILINGVEGEFPPGEPVMLLMKAKGLEGVGEMMGNIERVELINNSEGLFSLIVLFDQEKVPPVYKMWIAECIELIKVKPVINDGETD